MRVLSPASDAQSTSPSLHDPKPNVANEEPDTTASARTPSLSTTVPTVVLDTDIVSDNMAARLCASFLGHVLFLKNQVPFPIVQLARMPTCDNTTRVAKKRQELLNSFDALTSHLYTTFIALSTALALRGIPDKTTHVGTDAALPRCWKHGVARAFFAVALGPTVGTAKSRVMVGIDGLETKVWGVREDDEGARMGGVAEGDGDVSEGTIDSDDQSQDDESEDEASEGNSEEEDDDDDDDDDDASPPPSRSPSPALSSDSNSTSLLSVPDKHPISRAEDPETVRAAERLLSRTLASACAEDDGYGLAAEMAPTQIHVLLRAPRRFDHPSWIPRQNLCTSLDSCLATFLVDSGETAAPSDTTAKKRTKGGKAQGVWIRTRQGSAQVERREEDVAEEDELIWWSWDGKLTGFADW